MKNYKEENRMLRKSRVFIGSSSEGKDIAQTVKLLLEKGEEIEAVVWDKMFKIGETFIESLSSALEEFDFAVLVIKGDDLLIRGEIKKKAVRDNVLFELGLFMGRLGRYRTIMLYDEEQKADLPTDLGGIHVITFSKKSYKNLEDALKAPCKEIQDYILNPGLIEPKIRTFEVWEASASELYEALGKASYNTKIRIIQTWFPDPEYFIEELENIINDHSKRFEFQVLLINENSEFNILGARIKYRKESRERAIEKIKETIEKLKEIERLTLKLEIGVYDFLPFGPLYQVGNEVMFVGFYLNYCSSIHAPMLKINNTASKAWRRFEKHFEIGWENSKKIYPKKTNTEIGIEEGK
jgi:hypothetical protein